MIQDKGTIKNTFLTGQKPTQQQFADMIESSIGCIGKILAADFNTLADQSLLLKGGSQFIITDIIFVNPTINISVAKDGQLWSGAGRTGINSMAVAGPGPFGIAAGEFQAASNGYVSVTNKVVPAQNYFSLGTLQGAVAKCDIYVFGFPVAP